MEDVLVEIDSRFTSGQWRLVESKPNSTWSLLIAICAYGIYGDLVKLRGYSGTRVPELVWRRCLKECRRRGSLCELQFMSLYGCC